MFCRQCGTPNRKEEERCVHCGAPLKPAESVHTVSGAPPDAPAAGPPRVKPFMNGGERIARLGDRMLAVILDGVLVLSVYALLGTWVASWLGGITAAGFSMTGYPALTAMGLTAVFTLLYYWLLEGVAGITLGKLILGVKVRDLSGGPLTFTQSFLRNILRLVDGVALYLVGFLIALFSKRRQRLGDHAAKTIVIEKESATALKVLWVVIWAAAVGCALWGAYLIHEQARPTSQTAQTGEKVEKIVNKVVLSAFSPSSGSLQVVDFQFLEGEGGPVRSAPFIKPKEKVFARYRIVGAGRDEQGEVRLEGELTLSDPEQLEVLRTDFNFRKKDTADEPVQGWAHFTLPAYAPPGTYQFRIVLKDAVQNRTVRYAHPFSVSAPPPVIPNGLELREIKLSQSEEGPPLSPPVFPLGSKVHTSSRLAGVTFKEDSVQVNIAYRLFGPQGETILNKPDFLEIKDSWKYHPAGFFIPLTFHVTPPSGKRGSFTQQITVTDLVAKTSKVFSVKFEVR